LDRRGNSTTNEKTWQFSDLLENISPMSRVSRQRQREAKQHSHRRKFSWLIPIVVIALIGAGFSTWIHFHHPKSKEIAVIATHDPSQPRTLKELLALSPADLDKVDIGLMNLLCAEGLPGAEDLDVQQCLKKLDAMADYVKEETQRHEYRFREHPEDFKNSRAYFEMNMLGTILVQDIGIQYNPAIALPQLDGKIPTLGSAANSKDMFIHGLLIGNHYGTCASMPVLYVAIARRLGYPVDLASSKYHYYVRYEDYNNKHLNVEATSTQGFYTPQDDAYKNGQFPCTDEEIKEYGWLRPLTNKELLGHFLDTRGICLGDAKRYDEAKEMFLRSANCFPDAPLWRSNLALDLEQLKNAPFGDKIDDWRNEIKSWDVPQGARNVYMENRKLQVRYFLAVCPDASVCQKAVDDLKSELAEYRRQMTLTNPAPEFLEHGQHILDLVDKAGQELRLPAETLPPPLNSGNTPQDYLNCIAKVNFTDEGSIMDALWQHYKDVTTDWSNQPPLLPQHWQEAGITFPNSALTSP
jgi:hypothetical protein